MRSEIGLPTAAAGRNAAVEIGRSSMTSSLLSKIRLDETRSKVKKIQRERGLEKEVSPHPVSDAAFRRSRELWSWASIRQLSRRPM